MDVLFLVLFKNSAQFKFWEVIYSSFFLSSYELLVEYNIARACPFTPCVVTYYCALQVSCLGWVGKWHLSMSLYKLTAFVSCSITKLSSWEPLPIYPFHWTTDLQSAVPVLEGRGECGLPHIATERSHRRFMAVKYSHNPYQHSPLSDWGWLDRDFPPETATGWLGSGRCCSDLDSWLSIAKKRMKDYCEV